MPATNPVIQEQPAAALQALGEQVRLRRKALKVSAVAAAEAAGVSRVTLHRIEKGEPSVTMGAWANVLGALGMGLAAQRLPAEAGEDSVQAAPRLAQGWIPLQIRLADYPQLKNLAWQVHTETITPLQAHGIYERNLRHLDEAALTQSERALMAGLRELYRGLSAQEALDV